MCESGRLRDSETLRGRSLFVGLLTQHERHRQDLRIEGSEPRQLPRLRLHHVTLGVHLVDASLHLTAASVVLDDDGLHAIALSPCRTSWAASSISSNCPSSASLSSSSNSS